MAQVIFWTIDIGFPGVRAQNKLEIVNISFVFSVAREGHKGHRSSEKKMVLRVGIFGESVTDGNAQEVSL